MEGGSDLNNLFRQMLICEKKIHQIKLDSIQDDFNQNEWIIMNIYYVGVNDHQVDLFMKYRWKKF